MARLDTINLLIPSQQHESSEDLQSQIQRVVVQKGHFRHVTERSLLAEGLGKAPLDSDKKASHEDDTQIDDDEPQQKRQERLWKRREEMIERLSYAQNEILCALDFVSLLISKQWIPAQGSMSPALKDSVPVGTLAGRVLPRKPLSSTAQRQLTSASQGWRAESFRSASEKLSSASTRLQKGAEREAEYWAQVTKLTNQGWMVSRLPHDRKAIGVHFGVSHSAPQFRDRGFAFLRQLNDGSVTLDQRSAQRSQKALGVYIVRDTVKTGFYLFKPQKTSNRSAEDEDDITQQIMQMRDSLFEEELFYEICREARTVANQGVHIRAQAVDVAVGTKYQLSLVFGEDLDAVISTNTEDNLIAEFVAVSLRLLLNAAHEQNLAKRSRKAAPLTLKPRHSPEYALIRPILAHLRHRAEAIAFWTDCKEIVRPFAKAGLQVTLDIEKSTTKAFEALNIEAPSTFLSEIMIPAKSRFKIGLTQNKAFEIGLATFLGPPLFGSRYEISGLDFGFVTVPLAHPETREAAVQAVYQMFTLGLVSHIESLTKRISDGLSNDARKDNAKKWEVSLPHNGELTLCVAGDPVRKIVASVRPGLIVVQTRSLERGTSKHEIWSWTSDGCFSAGGVNGAVNPVTTFNEVVTKILDTSS
ncbi:uncharacterized protein PV06_05585 [Exophiala oligosperma]|uniref:Mediator of RNA polymerase II transcription subunit 17 n=1 Tax=Exophiala oligosperma TaxID=215243 RepID=A0A0D2E2K2_9EURO|nr:uncharacterized protein PV06_05585 [Exophiala oligosperma]KIW41994.1 hypothetical protein PV06_05585 [Exophiala oligosperma]